MDLGILLDEIHITVFLLADLPTDQIDSIRQILLDPSFLTQLQTHLLPFFATHPELSVITFTVSR
jgi:hypothetical protein